MKALAERTGIPLARLRHYNDANLVPSGEDLNLVLGVAGISELELMLAMGRLSREALTALQAYAGPIARIIEATQTRNAVQEETETPLP